MIHVSPRLGAMNGIQIPMPRRLVPDGLFQLTAHTRKVQPLQGVLHIGVEAGFYLAVRRQANAVAIPAEMGLHRTDKPDIAQSPQQAVELRCC